MVSPKYIQSESLNRGKAIRLMTRLYYHFFSPKRVKCKNFFTFCLIFFLLFGCGGGSSNNSTGPAPDPETENNAEPPSPIKTKYFQLVQDVWLAYRRDNDSDVEFDVCMNKDASKTIFTFYSQQELYAAVYTNGQWQEPVLLGDNGNIISSHKTHKVIMNDNGQAALIHFGDQRVGTPNNFAVSYFDGSNWQYTLEVEGTPSVNFYDDIICDIDANGVVYVVTLPQGKAFSIAQFDDTGLIGSKEFASGIDVPGYTFGDIYPKALATNDNNEVMVVYYYIEEIDSWPGFTAIFDGAAWSESQDWKPTSAVRHTKDPGKLRYNNDGSAYFVYGDTNKGLTYTKYDNGVWTPLHEGIYFGPFAYRLAEANVELNESGNELMVMPIDDPNNAHLYSEDGVTVSPVTVPQAGGPHVFPQSTGDFISIFGGGYHENATSTNYFSNGGWADTEILYHFDLQMYKMYFYMNKYGYLVMTNQQRLIICKFDNSLL